jgi:carbonic anhydrase
MQELLAGYRRFREEIWPREQARFEALAAVGQSPKTMVIACSDSRVDPQMIFAAAPGDMFVVRNVANLVPPYMPDAAFHGTSAALEFAVRVLRVERVVVLGHAQCGGVRALLEGAPPAAQDFVAGWMSIAQAARAAALRCDPADRQQACEHAAIRVTLDNLLTFPWVAEAVAAGRLSLYGGHFVVATGKLMLMGPDGEFSLA